MPTGNVPAAWGTTSSEELPLPSGDSIIVRRVQIEDLIATGLIGKLDSFLPEVDKHVQRAKRGSTPKKASRGKPVDSEVDAGMALLKKDPSKLVAILRVCDLITAEVCLEPKVAVAWTWVDEAASTVEFLPAAKREPDFIYTDNIPLGDKLAIFEWATGGLVALAQFREGVNDSVGGVESK